ncbi:hypothetical protein ANCDUO_04710 [Ancylostoma duodenale]|uniref:Uncharacterized protein n=1 Tax=Ancylostoma duodenale TaxID=51022 RepID=A0A0C2H6C6_9BILA|nr:hypothetical protein ANCDUO_04710 [Ancylostoma duodenale]
MQGKAPQLNRARGGRRKGKNLPHQADANLCEEYDDDDAENEDAAEQFSHCDLGLLRDYFNV